MAEKIKNIRQIGKFNTLDRLISCARTEFAQKGLAAARVVEIARKAGVTKQLIYHYYGSKENLFVATLDVSSAKIMSELISLSVDHLPPVTAMQVILNHFFDYYSLDPLLGNLAKEGIHFHSEHETPRNHFLEMAPAFIDKVNVILTKGAASGDFRPDINPRLLIACFSMVIMNWFSDRYSMSAIAGFDTSPPEGISIWRQYSADFVLAGISLRA